MKTQISLIVLTSLISLSIFARSGGGHHGSYHSGHSRSGTTHVSGYTKRNGTHVEPHRRTRANGTTKDNWSHRGNVNPDTGEVGTKDD